MSQKHVVLLVHGILTHASWFQVAKRVFQQESVRTYQVKYGRVGLLQFLLPGLWRKGALLRAEKILMNEIRQANTNKEQITIICHSNGTHIVSQVLLRNYDCKIHNLIMCGSVVIDNFDWRSVRDSISGKIINDYGVRDMWPAVAKSLTWGYGSTGTNGFGGDVDDRIHNSGHSDYFKPEFMRDYWLPIVTLDIVNPPKHSDDNIPESPKWFGIFELPLRWLILFVILTAGAWVALILLSKYVAATRPEIYLANKADLRTYNIDTHSKLSLCAIDTLKVMEESEESALEHEGNLSLPASLTSSIFREAHLDLSDDRYRKFSEEDWKRYLNRIGELKADELNHIPFAKMTFASNGCNAKHAKEFIYAVKGESFKSPDRCDEFTVSHVYNTKSVPSHEPEALYLSARFLCGNIVFR